MLQKQTHLMQTAFLNYRYECLGILTDKKISLSVCTAWCINIFNFNNRLFGKELLLRTLRKYVIDQFSSRTINIVKYWSMCEKETSLLRRGDNFSKITITIALTAKCKWNIVCINSWHLSYQFWVGQRSKVNKALSSHINKNDHALYKICYHIKDGNSAT